MKFLFWHLDRVLWVLALGLITIAVVLLGGCPKPTPTPAPPPPPVYDQGGYRICGPVEVLAADVCDLLFTSDGLACARCRGDEGCLDETDMIYCSIGGCATDPQCRAAVEEPAAAKRPKRPKRPR